MVTINSFIQESFDTEEKRSQKTYTKSQRAMKSNKIRQESLKTQCKEVNEE